MGVTGLWTVVQPCARPIKLETLNKKRLAVDASIWIYQFLKAVRDKEGNALRNSHVVGFFRRICKLLYFGILPVFVFDGGAPILKRQTIAGRKKRREGRREDAVRTAGKLLAVQMQRSAEEEAEARRQSRKRTQEEEVTETPVYVDDVLLTQKEKESRKFKKKDAYHLPNLDVSLEDMGAPNDPRIMSQGELEEYARQFHQGQDINLYDFSNIDFDSPFFISLPATDRYNILNAARLRSRLRMGYSKEQLDTMFPDRMAFSKFQIDRVKERNDLTQRLMNINGMNGEEAFYNSGKRIAGERGKEYVLVRDSEHEGGWVLGVVGNKDEGYEDKPINVEHYARLNELSGSDDVSEDDEFEDVPIEGVNRLPKLPFLRDGLFDESLEQAREDADLKRAIRDSQNEDEDDALFVQGPDDPISLQNKGLEDELEGGEDAELAQAIALSLESTEKHDEDMPDMPLNRPMPEIPHVNRLDDPILSDSDDGMDFAAAVAQTKVTKKPAAENPFSGPLPFQSMKLNRTSKPQKSSSPFEAEAGGFIKDPPTLKKKTEPLPPWFAGQQSTDQFTADPINEAFAKDRETETEAVADQAFVFSRHSPEIVDLEGDSDTKEIIGLDDISDTKQGAKDIMTIDQEKILNPSTQRSTRGDYPSKSDAPPSAGAILDSAIPFVPPTESLHPQKETPPPDHQTTAPSPESEFEDVVPEPPSQIKSILSARGSPAIDAVNQLSPEPEFEDVIPETSIQSVPVPPPSETNAFDFTNEVPEDQNIQDIFDQDVGEFSDPEDEDLMRQLAAEGEEHIRFAKTLNSAAPAQTALDYEAELKELRNQQQKDRRDADEVTTIMINECQQLLRLFGLPYITAPMEAEAQCAELVSLDLVDGIVTDDSDTFLFGGTRVYKNMFNQSKYVECYLTSDFEKEYALHRRKLISFAHLLGSDYTEGIPGIGPVTALEIVTEFPNLEDFRDWWSQIQMGVSIPDDAHAEFRKKFRKKASKIFLPPSFPDTRVDEAYLQPEVDSDSSQFKWGIPDMNGLRQFLMTTIGWSPERTDEILVPVIRDMNRREQEGTQANITQFFRGPQGAGAFAPRARGGGPSRMEKAFGRLRNEAQQARDPAQPIDPAEQTTEATKDPDPIVQTKTKRNKSGKQDKGDGIKKRKTRAIS